MFFGMPFLFGGLIALVASVREESTGEAIMGALIGLLFTAVGAAFMFGRAGVVIDRRRGEISTWWGLLVPFQTTRHKLSEFKEVTISHEIRKSKNSSYSVFPVRIAGGSKILVRESRDYEESRRLAEEVAKFIHVGIRDSGKGTETYREAGTLDESIRARAEREGRIQELPRRTSAGRCSITTGPNEFVIEIPPPGVKTGQWVGLVVVLLIVGILFFAGVLPMILDMAEDGIDNTFGFIIFGFFIFFFAGIPLTFTLKGIVKAATDRQRLVVSAGRFELNKKIKLEASEIEEIDVTYLGGEAVTLRTDKQAIDVGRGLSHDELQWLRDVLTFVLTCPPGQKLI
jgi:hypothetical protein